MCTLSPSRIDCQQQMRPPRRRKYAPNIRQVFCCWPILCRRCWWVSCAHFYRYTNSESSWIWVTLFYVHSAWGRITLNPFFFNSLFFRLAINRIFSFNLFSIQCSHDFSGFAANDQFPVDCIRRVTIPSYFGCNLYIAGFGFGRSDAVIHIGRLQQVSKNLFEESQW